MTLDQAYDELYGAIDENLRSDGALATRVGALESKMTAAEGDILDIAALIPEVPGRQLKLVDLGTEYTEELQEDISSGAFEKAVVGGYLTINAHVYIFAHPDYWLHTGDTECTTHHMVVIPAGILANGKMNLTNTAAGAYAQSDMRVGHEDTTDPENPVHVNGALETVRQTIITDFGESNILTHREYFIKTITSGVPSDGDWYNSDIDLMNEHMVYGCPIYAVANDGVNVPKNMTIDKTQLKLFVERPDLINLRGYWWLRDTASAYSFAALTSDGRSNAFLAGDSRGVRPCFALK